jgi:hypothetical protein
MTLTHKDIQTIRNAIYEALKLGKEQIARDLVAWLMMVAPHTVIDLKEKP